MKNSFKYFNLGSLFVFAFILFTSCVKETDDILPKEEELKFKIEIANNNDFGYILVNQNNQSMYFFAGDVTGGESNCNGGCANVWPPVIADIYDLELGNGLYGEDFETIYREDGREQLTFKGWPLYYFSPEADGVLEEAKETLGDGRGGAFHIAKPDYTVLLGKQAVVEGGEEVLYLVNDRGVSLYLNQADEKDVSNCVGGCAGVWPPFFKKELILPSTLDAYEFNTIQREDDLGPQLSFNGSPLYFFSNDELKQGSVLGQAGGPNATFFVVEPDGQ